jgi:hypothetical protein
MSSYGQVTAFHQQAARVGDGAASTCRQLIRLRQTYADHRLFQGFETAIHAKADHCRKVPARA